MHLMLHSHHSTNIVRVGRGELKKKRSKFQIKTGFKKLAIRVSNIAKHYKIYISIQKDGGLNGPGVEY